MAAGLSLVACSNRPPAWLSLVFDDEAATENRAQAPKAGRARRPPYKPPAPVVEAKAPEIVLTDWTGIYQSLPRDDEGQVQWTKALAANLISPKPGLAEDAKDEEPTDMDVELVPKGQPEFKALFSHKVHTSWMACGSCHPALFEMERGKTVITMEKINAGASCGACHGKVATPEPSTCPACHTGMGK
jgi:c(7)-type cytochrome triheme protein